MILPKEITNPYFFFKNIDSREMGLIVNKAPNVIRPKRRVRKVVVPGRNGSLTIDDDSFENYTKTIECAVENRKKISSVLEWLNGYGELVISTEPNRAYRARVDNQISISQMMRYFQKFQINFDVQPFAYSTNKFNDFLEIKKSSVVLNKGNVYSEPTLDIFGEGDITLIIGNQEYQLLNVDEYVTINSEIMEVYKNEENKNMFFISAKTNKNIFPIFETGENKIEFFGNVEKIIVQPNWRWF